MTKLKYLVLALVGAVLAMAGAANAGVTTFTVTPTAISGSGTVTVNGFTTTGGYTKVSLDWGDGSQTTLNTPNGDADVISYFSHKYSSVGTYTPVAYAYTTTSTSALYSGTSTTPVTVSAVSPLTDKTKAFQVYDPSVSSQNLSNATTSVTVRLRWTGATVPSTFTSFTGTVTLTGTNATFTAPTTLTFGSTGTVSFVVSNINAQSGGTIVLTSISISGTVDGTAYTGFTDGGWTYSNATGGSDARFTLAFLAPVSVNLSSTLTDVQKAANISALLSAAQKAAGTAIPAVDQSGNPMYLFQINNAGSNGVAAAQTLSGGTGVSVNYGTIAAAGVTNICATVAFQGSAFQLNFYNADTGARLHTLTSPLTAAFTLTTSGYIAYHYNDSWVADGTYVLGNNMTTWNLATTTYGTYATSTTQGGYLYTLWVKQLSGAGVAGGSTSGSSGCEISSSSISVLGVLFPLMLVIAGLVVLSRRNRA